MSLINQVLQDLDRRRAHPPGLPVMAPGVPLRALPEQAPSWPRRSVAAFAAAAIATGAAFAWHSAQGGSERRTAATPMPLQSTAAIVPAAAAAPALAASHEALGGGLHVAMTARPADEPSVRPAAPIVVAAATVVAAPAAAMPAAAMPAVAAPTLAAAAPAPAVAAPVVTAMLDKRIRPTTARDRAESEYQRGLELHRQGQDKESEAAFTKALDEDRGHAPARQALAVAWLGHGRSDDARQLLATGLAALPQQTALAMLLARIELDRNDTAAAMAVLGKSLDSTPIASAEVAAGRALLATLQQRQGQHADATLNFGAALRQDPRHGAWWIGLANSLAAEGKTDSAREAFERARASDDLGPELARYVEQSLRASAR